MKKKIFLIPEDISYIKISSLKDKDSSLGYREVSGLETLFCQYRDVVYPVFNPKINLIQNPVRFPYSWLEKGEKLFWIENPDNVIRVVKVNTISGEVFNQPYIEIIYKDRRRSNTGFYLTQDNYDYIMGKIEELEETNNSIWINYEL